MDWMKASIARPTWLLVFAILLSLVVLLFFFVVARTVRRGTIPGLPTENPRWAAPDGSFLAYSATGNKINYVVISRIPLNDVNMTQRITQHGVLRYFTMNLETRVRGQPAVTIRIGREAVLVVVTKQGTTLSGPCPFDYAELRQLTEALTADAIDRSSQAEVLQVIRSFIESREQRWPADLLREISIE